ncbi:MAG: SDR family NAD(P)-dependent oxidoreductase [Alphaproteobacteria bacterium]
MSHAAASFNPLDLTGRTILVTGATSGLGRAAALYLSRLGARILATGRDGARLDGTLAALEGAGHRGEVFDFADLSGIESWMAALTADEGPLDGAVHFAGQIAVAPVKALTAERVEAVIRINLSSALLLAKAFRKKKAHTENAGLVLVSSVAGLKGLKGQTLYSATKGGLISAARCLAVECAPDGLRVNCLAPGMVVTEGVEASNRSGDPGHMTMIEEAHPLGFGRPDDVSAAAAFLLADTGRWITGAVLAPDGGIGAT